MITTKSSEVYRLRLRFHLSPVVGEPTPREPARGSRNQNTKEPPNLAPNHNDRNGMIDLRCNFDEEQLS